MDDEKWEDEMMDARAMMIECIECGEMFFCKEECCPDCGSDQKETDDE